MPNTEEPSNVGTNGHVNEKDGVQETPDVEVEERDPESEDENEGNEAASLSINNEQDSSRLSVNGEGVLTPGRLMTASPVQLTDDSEGDEDSSDIDEEEEEEEDADDDEPALKYDLLGGSTPILLEKDSASTLAVSTKYLVRDKPTLMPPSLTNISRSSLWAPITA